jgi:K+-sensing histidine kinase KdpD
VSLAVYVFGSLLLVWIAENHRPGVHGKFAQQSRTLEALASVLVAFSAILLTSVVLLAVASFLDAKPLIFVYLLPTVVIAMHYGSTLAVLTSFASGLAAAYFFFPPKFSFYVADPLNVAELGFFLLLAAIASKAFPSRSERAQRSG